MRKIAGMLLLLVSTPNWAVIDEIPPPPPVLLDKVGFQISAKQWVTTKTALLMVNLNATLSNTDLVKVRADIMTRLNKIASGEWHLLQFERSQDSSGLEKLMVKAQARVDQSSLTSIYQNAKAVSKPGANYQIGGIEFKPSLDEVSQVKSQLREQLYKQAYDEIERINKIYTGQNYSLYQLFFSEGNVMPQPKAYQGGEMLNAMVMQGAPAAPALTVSNELTMTALVQVASNRQVMSNKQQ